MLMRLATTPGSWGAEPTNFEEHPPWSRVLDEIAGAGFAGTELGPLGFFPELAVTKEALDDRSLELVAGYVMQPLSDPGQLDAVRELTRQTCATLAALGAGRLVLIDDLAPARCATAGRAQASPRLADAAWAQLVAATSELAAIAGCYGLDAVFHPHVGTYVEHRDEIERLLAETDPRLLGLCLDTGHCAYAGIDPAELCERHAGRVRYLHLKDVDRQILTRARREGLRFQDAVAAGIFCPLGAGSVDFTALRGVLETARYSGWATIEQDRLPQDVELARRDAERSLAHLRRVGIAVEAALR